MTTEGITHHDCRKCRGRNKAAKKQTRRRLMVQMQWREGEKRTSEGTSRSLSEQQVLRALFKDDEVVSHALGLFPKRSLRPRVRSHVRTSRSLWSPHSGIKISYYKLELWKFFFVSEDVRGWCFVPGYRFELINRFGNSFTCNLDLRKNGLWRLFLLVKSLLTSILLF